MAATLGDWTAAELLLLVWLWIDGVSSAPANLNQVFLFFFKQCDSDYPNNLLLYFFSIKFSLG